MNSIKHNTADIIWKSPGSEIQVVSLNVNTSISSLYLIQARIKTADKSLDFKKMLRTEAEIVLKCGDEMKDDRIFSGIITRFTQCRTRHGNLKNASNQAFAYTVEIRPHLWMITRQFRSKVYQNKTCRDIVSDVLSEHGIKNHWKLTGSLRMREYCVQYRETDFNFISRLLEDEGICFYFDQEDGSVVFTNHAGGHMKCRPKAGARYVEEISPRFQFGKHEFISDFNYEEIVTTGSFVHQHYNYETSQVNLQVTDEEDTAPAFSDVERYEHTLNYVDRSEGSAMARLRREEAVSSAKVGRGTTSSRSFDAGFSFTMTDHFRDSLNVSWVLTSCMITAEQGQYKCQFTALPSDVVFRPPRRAERPRVTGLQTATVTGPSQSKVYLDEMGRCKLQFHWDREGENNDRSSMWVRVSNNYAGKDYGIQWIPRVGHEVLVTFIDGDPDLPVVTGRVYNDFNTAPLGPVNKWQNIIKSIKDNHIMFDDKDGNELVDVRAEKNMNTLVIQDDTQRIGNNRTIDVGVNHTETIGKDMSIRIGKNLNEQVGANYTESVGANMSTTVGANEVRSVALNSSSSVGQNYTMAIGQQAGVQVGKNIGVSGGKKALVDIADELTFSVGNATVVLKKNGDIQIKGKKINVKASGTITMKGSKIEMN
ncbi:MAG: type VI secretion system tip protein TssI/VgrG [Acidobacteriota bacterium]|nr:type VI secretion system tip protein TssI/VgrG [Acidobacteriota bacterium]